MIEMTLRLNDRTPPVRVALASDETFEHAVARVRKNGVFVEEEGTRRFIPPKAITYFEMDVEQVPPKELTPIGALTLRLVIVEHFDKKANVTGMYLNGSAVPGHIADWRTLASALAAIKSPLTVYKEKWTTTLTLKNLPPSYAELEKVAVVHNHEVLQEPK